MTVTSSAWKAMYTGPADRLSVAVRSKEATSICCFWKGGMATPGPIVGTVASVPRRVRAMVHNVVHFAIHADDVERARRFYEVVFGWQFEAWGPPGFYNVTTGAGDHPGIFGALERRAEPLSGTGTRGFTCTIAVDDLPAIRERVTANGGTITYEEVEIAGVGTLTQLLDTEGNEVAAMVYEREMYGL